MGDGLRERGAWTRLVWDQNRLWVEYGCRGPAGLRTACYLLLFLHWRLPENQRRGQDLLVRAQQVVEATLL